MTWPLTIFMKPAGCCWLSNYKYICKTQCLHPYRQSRRWAPPPSAVFPWPWRPVCSDCTCHNVNFFQIFWGGSSLMGGPSLNSLITFEELCRLTTRTSISKVTWLQGIQLLSDPGVPGVRGPVLWNSLTERPCWNLTDVTLADEDTNSILTDNANRAFQGNVAMQVAPSGGQICN